MIQTLCACSNCLRSKVITVQDDADSWKILLNNIPSFLFVVASFNFLFFKHKLLQSEVYKFISPRNLNTSIGKRATVIFSNGIILKQFKSDRIYYGDHILQMYVGFKQAYISWFIDFTLSFFCLIMRQLWFEQK